MPLQRVAVVGATGTVGRELLGLLAARRFPLQELVPIATEASIGEEVELLGHDLPITSEASLRGLDLVFLCTPRSAALGWMREALHQSVPCFDLSASAASRAEVPLLAADLAPPAESLRAPVIGCPSGQALAWALPLAAIAAAVGIERVVGTALESVAGAGRAGVATLEHETRALFNQVEPSDSEVFSGPIAFDCLPGAGEPRPNAASGAEADLVAQISRLLGGGPRVAATVLRVPTFAGSGAALAIETRDAIDAAAAIDLLAKAPGVELSETPESGPSMREMVGQAVVRVGRIRPDPSHERGLLLWLAADPVHLAAANALRLAEARLALA